MGKFDKSIKVLKEEYFRIFGHLAHDFTINNLDTSNMRCRQAEIIEEAIEILEKENKKIKTSNDENTF